MLVKELIAQLSEMPEDTHVYLDDKSMPTCLGLYYVEFNVNNGFVVDTKEHIKINTVILSTYNWHE